MKFLYQACIYAYSLSIKAAAIFSPKAQQFIKGRKNWKRNLASKIESNARYLWFHCASLGEFEQGRSLIEDIRKRMPEYRIVLSFFSPSGYEIRKDYDQADVVTYLPLDTKKNAKAFIKIVNPEKVFFIKYEYWYFYFSEMKKRGIPLYMVSAIFRTDQHFFKGNIWGKWYRQMLYKVTHLFVQDEKSAKLLQAIGINNYTVTGDTRFDRVAAIAQNAREISIIEKFRNNALLLVAGSTWKPDEDLLAKFINKHTELKLIIAPHEVTPANVSRVITLFNQAVRFSNLEEETAGNYHVLVIDSVGMLSSLYRYGDLAYIGGGFGVGIHNILEAATFGLPVIFGPNFEKFREAVDLISLGGAFSVKDYDMLENNLSGLLSNSVNRQTASVICKNYVLQKVGSTQIIVKKVFNL